MANTIALKSCKLQIRRVTGTLTSGASQINSISLTGVDQNASADAIMNFADAVGALISTPILEVLRVDENVVYADE